jgi:hypothetical protein
MSHFHHMPVDRTEIKTRIRLHPDFRANPKSYILKNNLSIRTCRPWPGKKAGCKTWNVRLEVLTYKGIGVDLCQASGSAFTDAKIHFNPGVCLYGHNGRTLTLYGFIHALIVLAMHLRPLLANPDDWTDLIPGTKRGGSAYWSFLEVLFQCFDPSGKLLAAFRNLRHPDLRITRHWPDSIRVGGHRSKLVLSIYLKGIEMVRCGKLPEELLPQFKDVLRIEARMKKEKLIKYFDHGHNVEVIDGDERLTSFFPSYLFAGHRAALTASHGVYSPVEPSGDIGSTKPNEALGRLLAQVAKDPCCGHTFHQLLADLKHYTGAGDTTISDIRKAGEAALSRMSDISSAELFSDKAYASMCGISSPAMEQMIDHSRLSLEIQGVVAAAYCPPDQPLCPFEDFPEYFFR